MRVFFVAEYGPGVEVFGALVETVAVAVGGDGVPAGVGDAGVVEDVEFVVGGEVVADVPVVDGTYCGGGDFQPDRDRNRCPSGMTIDLAGLLSTGLSSSTGVAA